jgi:MarR family 2-MHQ and catechol resistance regulon transcriptional repressor
VATTRGLDDQRLTTVGLLFESSAGLRRLFSRQLESERALPSQSIDVLIRLARTPGDRLRMTELAAQTSLTPSGLTRSVDRLQQQGLVTRQTCPDDRRGAFAVLTDEGRDLMARVIPEHLAHVDAVLSSLFSPKEEDQLASALRRLRDYAREQLVNDQLGDDSGCPSA